MKAEKFAVAGTVLVGESGAWEMVVKEGAMRLVPVERPDLVPTDHQHLGIIVRVGRNPSMKGLAVGGRTFAGTDEGVIEGPCEGPRIPV